METFATALKASDWCDTKATNGNKAATVDRIRKLVKFSLVLTEIPSLVKTEIAH